MNTKTGQSSKTKGGKGDFRAKSQKDVSRDHQARLKGATDQFTRDAINHAEKTVETVIFRALQNTVRLDIDYESIAMHQDKAMNLAGTQTHRRELDLPPTVEKMVLNSPTGAAIEDRNGTLIAIRLPNALDFVHKETVKAGSKFSQKFKFKKQKHRNLFKKSNTLFKSGHADFAYWHAQGRLDCPPTVSRDSRQPHVLEFHEECAAFFHTINIYTERIAPDLADQSCEVWDTVRARRDQAGYLNAVKTHFPNHAVHFNAGTNDPKATANLKTTEGKKKAPSPYHKDIRSCWGGFDAIGVMGEYEGGELEFPDLGYSFPSRPGDLFFIRGAAFRHGAVNWQGKGRMVFALYSDKSVFTKEHIPRPQDLGRVYGPAHGAFRKLFPIIPHEPTVSDNGEGDMMDEDHDEEDEDDNDDNDNGDDDDDNDSDDNGDDDNCDDDNGENDEDEGEENIIYI